MQENEVSSIHTRSDLHCYRLSFLIFSDLKKAFTGLCVLPSLTVDHQRRMAAMMLLLSLGTLIKNRMSDVTRVTTDSRVRCKTQHALQLSTKLSSLRFVTIHVFSTRESINTMVRPILSSVLLNSSNSPSHSSRHGIVVASLVCTCLIRIRFGSPCVSCAKTSAGTCTATPV